jgi:hypothetical protein
MFPQLEGLKLEADAELIYVFDVDADPTTDDSKHPMVSVFITDTFIGEVKPKKKHHQAYTPSETHMEPAQQPRKHLGRHSRPQIERSYPFSLQLLLHPPHL